MSHFRLHTRTNGKDRLKYVIAGIACILAVGAAGYALHSIGTARAKSRETVELHTGEELEQYLLDSESEDYNLNGSYRLEEDLELGWLYQSIGNNVEPFTGKFDGNGHVISGLERPLFGVVKKAEIENLFFSGALITEPFTYYDGEHYVDGYSALAAYAVDSKIRNCGMDGEIYTASPSEAEYQVAKASPADAEERKKPSETESSEAPESSMDVGDNGVGNGAAGGNGAGGSGDAAGVVDESDVIDETEEDTVNGTDTGNENETGDIENNTPDIEVSIPDDTNQETDSQTENNTENPGNEGTQESEDHTDISEVEAPEQGEEPEVDIPQEENADQPEAPAENTASVHPVNRQYLMLKISELPDAEAEAAAKATPSDADQADGETTDNSQPDKELPEPASPSDAKDTETDKEEIEYIGNPFGDVYILVTADRVTAGGLVAETAGETLISDSFVLVSLSSELDGVETYAGGLAGILGAHTRTENSYASGVLSCDDIAGGFAAINDGRIENSYSSMVLGEAGTIRGGFTALGTGKFKGCVYDKQMACAKDRNEDTELEETEQEETLTENQPSGFPEQLPPDESQTETEEDHTGMIQVGPGEWIEAPVEQPGADELFENPEQPDPIIAQEPATPTQVRELPEFTLKGLPTSQMVGLDAQIPGTWYYSENAYPQLESFAYSSQEGVADSSKASAIALVLPDEYTLFDVLEDGELILPSEIDGQEIQWEAEGNVIIDENNRVYSDKGEQREPEKEPETVTLSDHEAPEVGSPIETSAPEENVSADELPETEITAEPTETAQETITEEASTSPEETTIERNEETAGDILLKGTVGASAKSFSVPGLKSVASYAVTGTWQNIAEKVESGELPDMKPVQNATDGYYEIYTPEALAWFAYKVNSGDRKINARLMDDIDLFGGNHTGNTYVEARDNIDDALPWVPIGYSYVDWGYQGVFDGNNKTISHMLVNDTALDDGTVIDCKGFVGALCSVDVDGDEAVIKDLGIQSGKISNMDMGNSRSIYMGGITGTVGGLGKINIVRCWNGASILYDSTVLTSSYTYVGGICGFIHQLKPGEGGRITIDGCYNTGFIKGYTVGGIVGSTGGSKSCIVINCYNTGRVRGESYGGGIVGSSNPGNWSDQKIIGCYNLGECIGGSKTNLGGICGILWFNTTISGCFYDSSMSEAGYTKYGTNVKPVSITAVTPAQLNNWAVAFALNNYGLESESSQSSWAWTEGGIPTLYNPAVNPEKKLIPAKDWSVVGQAVADGFMGLRATGLKVPVPEGDGSQDNPYVLTNAEQLAWFAKQVNNENFNINAKMTANMDLSGTAYTGMTSEEVTGDIEKALVWVPICNYRYTYSYTGIFDGNGHHVTAMLVKEAKSYGLFGRIGSTENPTIIKDVGIKSGKITMLSGDPGCYGGGIAGKAEGSNIVIQRCWNGALVTDNGCGGGIVGLLNTDNSLIEGCYNLETIDVGSDSGGIVGYVGRASHNLIKNCYNLGDVAMRAQNNGLAAGGIIGRCQNGVSDDTSVPYYLELRNCYSSAKLSGQGYKGGIIGGSNWKLDMVSNCYYDASKIGTAGGGLTKEQATGVTAEHMKSWALAYALNGYRREAKDASEASFTWKEGEYPSLYWDGKTDDAGNPIEKLGPASDWSVIGDGMEAGLIGNPYTGERYSLPAGDGVTTPYQIGSAEQLAWFANQITNATGSTKLDAELTAYIDLGGDAYVDSGDLPWIPIGYNLSGSVLKETIRTYGGIFDGGGYMIDRMYAKARGNIGLFSYAGEGAVIKNVGIGPRSWVESTGPDNTSDNSVTAAIVAMGYSKQAWVTANASAVPLTIEGCYSRATVKGNTDAKTGGIFGSDSLLYYWDSTYCKGKIAGCYVAGPVSSATGSGYAIAGWITASKTDGGGIYNCYWDNNILSSQAVCNGPTTAYAVNCSGKTTAEMKAEAIITLLNTSITEKNWIYNNTATSKVNDGYPILKTQNLITTWAGVAALGLPAPTVQSPSSETSTYGTEDNPYLLSSAEDLAWFANEVNNGKLSLCGKLMTDIDLFGSKYSGVDCAADGSNIESAIEWVSMGVCDADTLTWVKGYTGIFDGNGHHLSNVFMGKNENYHAFIGMLGNVTDSGTVKDLGIKSGKISAKHHAAGIATIVAGESQVRRCWNGAEIITESDLGGGIAAEATSIGGRTSKYNPVIEGCYNIGKVSSSVGTRTAGIVAHISGNGGVAGDGARIRNCYNLGAVTGVEGCGGIYAVLASNATKDLIENCYNGGTCTVSSSAGKSYAIGNMANPDFYVNCYYDKQKSGYGIGTSTADVPKVVRGLTEAQIKSWGMAWALNGYGLESTGATGVTDITDTTDTTDSSFTGALGEYPTLCWSGDDDFEDRKLKASTWLDIGYGVENQLIGDRDTGQLIPVPSGDGTTTSPCQLANAEQLSWFAYKVSEGFPAYCGTMTADMDMFGTKYTGISYDSSKNNMEQGLRWVSMGKNADVSKYYNYGGIFDGGGHQLSNLLVHEITNTAGFVATLSKSANQGILKDLGIKSGKIIGAGNNVGALAGVINGSGNILRCWNGAAVSGKSDVGGIVGPILNCREVNIEGCYNTGDVTGTTFSSGGIAASTANVYTGPVIRNCGNTGNVKGANSSGIVNLLGLTSSGTWGTIANCYNAGVVAGTEKAGAIMAAKEGTVMNCYYDRTKTSKPGDGITSTEAKGVTTEQLQSWSAAYALNGYGLDQTEDSFACTATTESAWTYLAADDGTPVYPTICWPGSADADAPKKLGAPDSWEDIGLGMSGGLIGNRTTGAVTARPGGTGEASSPYVLANAEQLAWFAYEVNHGRPGISGRMTGDIDLFGTPYTGIAYDAGTDNIDDAVLWMPMGTRGDVWNTGYQGTFDGEEHSLRHMSVVTTSTDAPAGFIGMLGVPSVSGTVKNLGIGSGKITGASYAGGIAGLMVGANSKISGCWNAADIVGGTNTPGASAGGIVGMTGISSSTAFSGVVIEGCWNQGAVSVPSGGTINCGGIAGRWFNVEDSTIRNCYNLGTIGQGASVDGSMGGILGNISVYAKNNKLEYCYNAGNIASSLASTTGAIVGSGKNADNSIIGCYYDTANSTGVKGAGSNVTEEEARSLTTAQLQSWAAAYALNRNGMQNSVSDYGNFTWKSGEYPSLCYAGSADYDTKKLQPAESWEVIGQGVKDQLLKDSTGAFIPEPVKDGTAYAIECAEQLGWFGMTVNSDVGNQTLNANLTKDIDLLGARYGGTEDARIPWIPIGTYQGHFGEGQAKVYQIKNLFAGGVPGKWMQSAGLIGILKSTGQVMKIGMEAPVIGPADPDARRGVWGGGIAAQMDGAGTMISRCYARNAVIRVGSVGGSAGGIAGQAKNGGKIQDCYTIDSTISSRGTYDGSVSAASGILGYYDNTALPIENCYVAGNTLVAIQGSNQGGKNPVGYNAVAKNCYSDVESDGKAGVLEKTQKQTDQLNTLDTTERMGDDRVWYTSLSNEATHGYPTLDAPVKLTAEVSPAASVTGVSASLKGEPLPDKVLLRGLREEGGSSSTFELVSASALSPNFSIYGYENANKKLAFRAANRMLTEIIGYASLTDPVEAGQIASLTWIQFYNGAAYTAPKRTFMLDVCDTGKTTRYEICITVKDPASKTMSLTFPVNQVTIELEPGVKRKSESNEVTVTNENGYPLTGRISGVTPLTDKNVELMPIKAKLEPIDERTDLVKAGVKLGISGAGGGTDEYYYNPKDGGKWVSYDMVGKEKTGENSLKFHYFMEYSPLYAGPEQTFGYKITYSSGIPKEDVTTTTMTADTAGSGS
ncbi:hypothetical protein [Hungatella hathewayi]|uniref:GLUG domain-containing protein n=1 Tax=Hungatella hathewayi WAL-18680 TaxID=742737 RepID=G5ICU6_9FIRM|nr:hypothetical protein [Hungatella hathewayi]EHI60717.1 hypothetical protein HMPREF9473_01281 [ [Hungatella hathewayi WAL-18680]